MIVFVMGNCRVMQRYEKSHNASEGCESYYALVEYDAQNHISPACFLQNPCFTADRNTWISGSSCECRLLPPSTPTSIPIPVALKLVMARVALLPQLYGSNLNIPPQSYLKNADIVNLLGMDLQNNRDLLVCLSDYHLSFYLSIYAQLSSFYQSTYLYMSHIWIICI